MFYETKISQEQKQYAWGIIRHKSLGHRGNGTDGNREMQYTGFLGEVILADLLEIPRPTGGGGFDHGIDFQIHGVNVDLKTMGRTCHVRKEFVNNLMASQIEYSTHVYLFASIHKELSKMQIMGWISKRNIIYAQSGIKFLNKGEPRKRMDGTTFEARGDLYEIPMNALKEFGCAATFEMDMMGFKLYSPN